MDSKNAAKRSESPAALGGKPQGFSIRDDTKKSSAQRRTEKPVPPSNNDDDFFNSANQGGAGNSKAVTQQPTDAGMPKASKPGASVTMFSAQPKGTSGSK